jgi:hypothetical protein
MTCCFLYSTIITDWEVVGLYSYQRLQARDTAIKTVPHKVSELNAAIPCMWAEVLASCLSLQWLTNNTGYVCCKRKERYVSGNWRGRHMAGTCFTKSWHIKMAWHPESFFQNVKFLFRIFWRRTLWYFFNYMKTYQLEWQIHRLVTSTETWIRNHIDLLRSEDVNIQK